MNFRPVQRRRGARPALFCIFLAAALSACGDRGGGTSATHGIAFPADRDIAGALQANFDQDPDNARAKALVTLLGGEKGTLEYRVRRVVYRQGAFEAQYDVSLRMGQAGAESLKQLYAGMLPKDEAAKLPEQTAAAYEKWLRDNADATGKSNPQQAATIRQSLDALNKCYADAKPDQSVALMDGLAALVSPAREGWYAEKLQTPGVVLRCLPL